MTNWHPGVWDLTKGVVKLETLYSTCSYYLYLVSVKILFEAKAASNLEIVRNRERGLVLKKLIGHMFV